MSGDWKTSWSILGRKEEEIKLFLLMLFQVLKATIIYKVAGLEIPCPDLQNG